MTQKLSKYKELIPQIKEFYNHGYTQEAIGNKLNLSKHIINNICREYKICSSDRKFGRNANLIAREFGKLKVIGKTKYKAYICECSCGNKIIYFPKELKNLKSCKKCVIDGNYREVPASYFKQIQYHAKERDIDFNLSKDDLWNLFLQQNQKCAISGIDLSFARKYCDRNKQTASLDRIDSDKSYSIGNVQWVHKDLNYMKQDLDEQQFIEWCHKVSKYQENKLCD